jgi:hypothetical protein
MRRVFVVLIQFTGDNLALNQVFGMTKSLVMIFSAHSVIAQEKRARPSSLSGSRFAEDIETLLSRSAHQIHIESIEVFQHHGKLAK